LEHEEMFVTWATSLPMGIKKYQNDSSLLLLAKALGKMTFFSSTTIMIINKEYRTSNFIMINNILVAEELNKNRAT
jgi:hypothetical protein